MDLPFHTGIIKVDFVLNYWLYRKKSFCKMKDILATTGQGTVRGTIDRDYYGDPFYKFLGIPYAKAPIGPLRFKSPQPPEQWEGIRDCTKEGPECPSPHVYFKYFVGHEDNCLNLNVFTKELPNGNSILKKPVMMWIYGGGFLTGCSKIEMYGPGHLMTQDIVFVSINYRLGILGFACFEDQSIGVPGNAGLKDMRAALQWINKNIHNFGGDPDNVTIFGESAGAASVHYLTLSPSTKGLFHKAIMQSGCALNNWSWGKPNVQEIAKCFRYQETDEKVIYEKISKEPARNVVAAQERRIDTFYPRHIRPWGPVVEKPSDDAFLTEHPLEILKSGKMHHVPVIMGYNSKEGIFFEVLRKGTPGLTLPRDFELEIPYELGLELKSEESKMVADEVKKYYFGNEECNQNTADKAYVLKGDTCFVRGIYTSYKYQTAHNRQTFVYRMTVDGPLNYIKLLSLCHYFIPLGSSILLTKICSFLPSVQYVIRKLIPKFTKKDIEGVAHADDLFYLFHTFFSAPITKDSQEDIYVQRFVKMWTNFARTGQPTPEDDPLLSNVNWKPIQGNNMEVLDIGNDLRMTKNVDEERIKFWDNLYHKYHAV